jgi:hypothetical protein
MTETAHERGQGSGVTVSDPRQSAGLVDVADAQRPSARCLMFTTTR